MKNENIIFKALARFYTSAREAGGGAGRGGYFRPAH
jgi:hypothetical protein